LSEAGASIGIGAHAVQAPADDDSLDVLLASTNLRQLERAYQLLAQGAVYIVMSPRFGSVSATTAG
jgi:hypothetical protein